MKYRHEYKHEISLADAIDLRQRLKAVICKGLQQTQKINNKVTDKIKCP